MKPDTDYGLKNYLDTNQKHQEQLASSILRLDSSFSNVVARSPSGGRDGGRDIDAKHSMYGTCHGAVSFVAGCIDSSPQKKRILAKFKSDLQKAAALDDNPRLFIFFTNINFSPSEKTRLMSMCKSKDMNCDLYDRERIRGILDSPQGFFLRFQYLNIPLTADDQASFLSVYGDRLQEVLSDGFGRLENSINRILFLQESSLTLDTISVVFRLDREYSSIEINHMRIFMTLSLPFIPNDILMIHFGISDGNGRFNRPRSFYEHDVNRIPKGIDKGISGAQWERRFPLSSIRSGENNPAPCLPDHMHSEFIDLNDFIRCGSDSDTPRNSSSSFIMHYRHSANAFMEIRNRISLRDIFGSDFAFRCNKSFSRKIDSFTIFSNGYILFDAKKEDFSVTEISPERSLPQDHYFTDGELSDPWVSISPSTSSTSFSLDFEAFTPIRHMLHKVGENPYSYLFEKI